jgi:CBS domain containing-hemolysin-like protein
MSAIIFVLILSLVLSAFFSGMEMSFVSANKLQVELDSQKGTWGGKQIAGFIKNPSKFINTILVGNNISLVVFGLMASSILTGPLTNLFGSEWLVLLAQTVITTMIVLVCGEFFPKAIFRVFANPMLKFFILPFFTIYVLLFVIAKFFEVISHYILRLFGVRVTMMDTEFTPVDLEHFVKEHSVSEEQDREIDTNLFENALYFRETKVRECMIPRTEVAAIEVNSELEALRKLIIETHHSRILVYRDTIDNMIGYVHHFDLLLKSGSIREIMMPIKPVTETTYVHELLNEFIKEARSISYVVDEYGGTAGIITLEDILEEIFGEIQDEHDDERVMARQISEHEFILSGRLEVDKLNSEFDLKLPEEGDYETISGFILMHHENIPDLNEVIEIEGFTFTILEVTEKKIETVKLTLAAHNDLI